MAIISNTSPVIALARVGRLDLLKAVYGTVLIPPAVKVECVDKGREVGARDVHEIERAMREGWLKVAELEAAQRAGARRLTRRARIGAGEAEAIVLANERKMLVILDDAEARAVAKSLGVEHKGTVMVPYEAFARHMIPREALAQIITDLSKVLWISSAVIAEVLRRAEEVRP